MRAIDQPGAVIDPRQATSLRAWAIVQYAVWLCGAAAFLALLLRPQLGLHAIWNVLIPAAPAVFVFLPGVWRNICPLGASALFTRRFYRLGGRPACAFIRLAANSGRHRGL